MSLYDDGEGLPQESTAGATEGLGNGSALLLLGKTAKRKFEKSGKTAVVSDLFICNFTPENSANNIKFLNILNQDGVFKSIEFPKDAKGELVTWNQPLRINFMEADQSSSPQAINMFLLNRRHFAKKFTGALVDEIVQWPVIQKAAGTFVQANLVKNGKYVNVDIDSIEVYSTKPAPQELLVKLYQTLDAEIQKRREAKQVKTEAPPDAVAPPPEDDLPF